MREKMVIQGSIAVILALTSFFKIVICLNNCNYFKGKWVYDNHIHNYNTKLCNFLEKQFDCQRNGRPDKDYLKYRWKPSSCILPRFNGEDFLKKFRGKRMMFVGDSLSLNQWQSLTCLLRTSVPRTKYTLIRTGRVSSFNFPSYNISVKYSRNALLVDEIIKNNKRIINLDSVTGNARLWMKNDVLVFNTWRWWLHVGKKQLWDSIKDGNVIHKDMDRVMAYEKALHTWGKWVNFSLDTTKTKVFFQGISPDHENSKEWGDEEEKTCKGETTPFFGIKYPGGGGGKYDQAEQILEKLLSTMHHKVHFLNIKSLSQLRKDGHPSSHGIGGSLGSDCSHWCLPGVPDTWNQIFYATLFQKLHF